MKEKIEYETPEIEIVWLESEDVIATSGLEDDDKGQILGE